MSDALNFVKDSSSLSFFGRVFQRRGAKTTNDESYMDWNLCFADLDSVGTFAEMPLLSLLLKVMLISFGAML